MTNILNTFCYFIPILFCMEISDKISNFLIKLPIKIIILNSQVTDSPGHRCEMEFICFGCMPRDYNTFNTSWSACLLLFIPPQITSVNEHNDALTLQWMRVCVSACVSVCLCGCGWVGVCVQVKESKRAGERKCKAHKSVIVTDRKVGKESGCFGRTQ